jgi:hypothetical protein
MRHCFLIAVFILAGCTGSGTWPPNRADCVLGIPDGLGPCAPGTRGYEGSEAQQQTQQLHEMLAAAVRQHNEDFATCLTKFSESNKDAVARAECFNEADRKFAPTTKYPDLIALMIAKRTELAERQAEGKITRAQVMFEQQQLLTQLISEEQRRNSEANAVAAQVQANKNAAALMLLQSMQANRPAPLPTPTPLPATLNTNCQTYGGTAYCQTR